MSVNITENTKKLFEQIHHVVDEAKRITITTHVNPDGDAIGSTLAFYHYLCSLGKECRIIIHSSVPYNFQFLSNADNIQTFDNNQNLSEDYILASDAIFVIDLNDIDRTKSPAEIIKKSKARKIVIDHHINPKEFADIYLVDDNATSAGELVYYLIKSNNEFQLDKTISECLYSAIMTDTGTFRFPRTDGNIHRIIADLIDCGADPVMLFEKIYSTRPPRVIKLLGEAFAGLEMLLDGKLCVMTLTKEHFNRAGASNEDVEDIVEQSLTIQGTQVGILFSQMLESEEIRISFRSKGDINIRDVAVKFNGGGHQHAAGARLFNMPMEEAKAMVIEEVEKMLGNC
ncbi:MAG: bifunctional oligoribonuclease/PAP phosphatase NrnA [bacterium]